MTADQVVWSEQGRLHLSYTGEITNGDAGTVAGGQITLAKDIDGVALSGNNHGIRVNDLVIVASSEGVEKCIVTKTNVGTSLVIEVAPYGKANLNATFTDSQGANSVTVFVYGSEFRKGDTYQGSDTRQANTPQFKSFTNKPIIMKDYYEVSGSDASRIGWVEISTENGQGGYLWYLKAEADTRARFTDYIEMAMLESKSGGDSDDAMSGTTIGADDLVDNYLEGGSRS